jgi:hypothetical protein
MQRQIAMRTAGVVLLVAFLALVAAVATSPPAYLYDEEAYANYIPLLRQHGLTREFLVSLTGATGPLHAFVHLAFEPATGLGPVRMRLVNVALLVVVAGILAAWLKRRNCSDYLAASASILVVPMTWVLAGLALTEMPAMVFATLSLYLQLRGIEALEKGRPPLGWFVAGGVMLGIAIWGRQLYLVTTAVPVLLALLDRRMRIPALVFGAIAVAFVLPLVIAWEGFVPPTDEADEGLSPVYGMISLGYAGICFFLLAPRLLWAGQRSSIMAAAVAVVVIASLNAALGIVTFYPLQSIVDRLLSGTAVSAYGILCGSLLLICGLAFVVWMLRATWQGRGDLKLVTINIGLLCVVLSPMLIGNFYSSRYTAMALPYLILAAQPWRQWGWMTSTTAVVGCGLGFLSLQGYFWGS